VARELGFYDRFTIDPSLKIKKIFFGKKMIIIKAELPKNKLLVRQLNFPYPEFDLQKLLYLISLIDGRNRLSDILRKIQMKYNIRLSIEKICDILKLLFCSGLFISIGPVAVTDKAAISEERCSEKK